MASAASSALTSLTHWGAFTATVDAGRHHVGDAASRRCRSVPRSGQPARIGATHLAHHVAGSPARLARQRAGRHPRRGADDFVAVSWGELTELLAGELRRVIDTHGNQAIYGGSYGWASAGRFHHAQSQIHRFLNCLGGYTFSRHSYSLGATGVIMPRVVGTHDDFSGSRNDPVLMAMPKLTEPYAEARDDYATTTRRSPHSPAGSASTISSPRGAQHGSGLRISTKPGPHHWISRCNPSTSSGRPAG
nr:molybdopterin-dependent oxidoreductase [Mycolicibacterium pyrenivorans]